MPRRSIILVTAFAALLAISVGAAWAIWQNTEAAQARSAQLHERDLMVHETLADIRVDVYLLAILTRDSLLEVTPDLEDYRQQFTGIQNQTSQRLNTLRSLASGPDIAPVLRQLAVELGAYEASTEAMLAWTPETRQRERESALRQRVGRRRDILALAERIETLAAQSTAKEHQLQEAADLSLRSSLGWIAGFALLLGAGVVGVTLTRMRSLEEQSRIAEFQLRSLSGQLRTTQENERRHLSRELHDQVGQMLTGLRMELAAITRSAEGLSPEAKAALEHAKQNAEQTLSAVRNIAMLLRPSMLDDLGLTPAIVWLAKALERSSGIEIRREIEVSADLLPDSHRTCLYRAVQEALTNAAKHSGARTIHLRLSRQDGAVRVLVQDDGRGFDPLLVKGTGLGLLGMEERVRELGGQLQIISGPGRGTSLEILLPDPDIERKPIHANHDGHDRRRPRHRTDGIKTTV